MLVIANFCFLLQFSKAVSFFSSHLNMSSLTCLQNGFSEFAFHLHKEISKQSGKNVFISPYSVSMAMSMLFFGTKGETAKQLKSALGLKELRDEVVKDGLLETIKSILKVKDDVVLSSANKLFPDKSFPLEDEFLNLCIKYFQSEVKGVDFRSEPEESRSFVNEWAEAQTRNKINNLLPPGSIDSLTKLVIANAIYFKGDWMHKFEKKSTILSDFYVDESKTTKVQMMSQKQKLNLSYDPELGVQVLELPYKGGKVSMILLVPTERFGLNKLEAALTLEKVKTLISQFTNEEVVISLPRMKLEFDIGLVPMFKALGVQDVFNAEHANLKGMSNIPGLYVSGIFHKTFLEVNEEGSEAAAATAVVIRLRSMARMPVRVTCDHPFMFLIKHKPTNSILFMGKFTSPSD